MSPVFLFSLLLIIACSDGAATARKRSVDIAKWLEKVNGKSYNKQVVTRQSSSACLNLLDSNLLSFCNFTELSGGLSSLALSDQQLDALNTAYSRICVPACLDPIEEYYNCLALPFDYKDYLITLLRRGVCGQESGDFCEVRYIRQYDGDYSNFDRLTSACTFRTGGIYCSGASSTCLNYVSTFSSRMGCCTQPYLGSGVTSCSGVSVSDACSPFTGPTAGPTGSTTGPAEASSATELVAPVFVILFAFVSYFV
uniref:Uncharacterized protein n=1 Tax=Amphimedon queenslandica TaxID=400682 RepID=A0A1X7UQW8_AMPQE